LDQVARSANAAMKAAWYHKWLVHRRLRPEEAGGRIHHHLTGTKAYPLHPKLTNSAVLERLYSTQGSYLCPQADPEGCPTHPAYPGATATIGGAGVRVLRAMFNPNFVLPDPVVPSDDGLSLRPWKGEPLTVGGELNKLAFNMASAATPPGSTSAETRSKASCSPSCTSPAAWPMPTPLLAGHQGALHALDRVPSAAGANPGARLGRTPADEQTAVIAREEVSHGPPATHCAEPGRRRPAPGRHRTTALAGLTATAAD
jgi:hypothetical protein